MKKSKKDIVSQREKTREKSAREEMLDERKSSPRRDRPRGGETPIKKTESENEEDFLEEKRRNPQDKSHLAYHDERFRCRKMRAKRVVFCGAQSDAEDDYDREEDEFNDENEE